MRGGDAAGAPFARGWPVVLGLVLLVLAYAAYFSLCTVALHNVFATYAYDLGTFDQEIWLAGHTTEPFVTVRGLHVLGDHVRLFAYVLAPFYWIWDDVRFLLVLQSVAIASGAVFVYLIARHELPRSPLVGLALAASYLLNPANQNLNLDHAHPDAFAQTFILASIFGWRAKRPALLWISAVLAMSCKEDVPFVYVALGVCIAFGGQRRLGLALAAVAGAYFLACVYLILPHFNSQGFFRLGTGYFFDELRKGVTDAAWLRAKVFNEPVARYLFALGLPVAFVFLLAPVMLVPALPQLAVNLLSGVTYTRTIDYHYTTSIVPFLYLATAVAARKLVAGEPIIELPRVSVGHFRRLPGWVLAVFLFVPFAVVANVGFSKVPVTKLDRLSAARRTYQTGTTTRRVHEMLAQVPDGAVVSADYSLVPHLAHRKRIYMFPNPFRARYWGIKGENPHDPDTVEYIIGRAAIVKEADRRIVDELVEDGYFELVTGDETLWLYKRVSSRTFSGPATCGDWNGDGRITMLDARRISAAITSKSHCPAHVCDTDGDGRIVVGDAQRVQRVAAGEDVALACPPEGR